MVLTLRALIIARSGFHCVLKYQHWPMKRILVVDQKGYQWCTVPNIIRTKLILKHRIYPQYSMFTAAEVPTDMPLVVLG